jgi:DNA-binding response OmpR family regulator
MPGPDGLYALRHLRKSQPDLPVVIVTSFGSPELHALATRMGARAVIDKPFRFSSLLAEILKALPARTTHREG